MGCSRRVTNLLFACAAFGAASLPTAATGIPVASDTRPPVMAAFAEKPVTGPDNPYGSAVSGAIAEVEQVIAAQSELISFGARARQTQQALPTLPTPQKQQTLQRSAADLPVLNSATDIVARSAAEATDAVASTAQDLDAFSDRLDALLQQLGQVHQAPAQVGPSPAAVSTAFHTVPDTPSWPYDPHRAHRAIAFALAQIGKPYAWGGTGPGAYDCSGLTMRSYQAAGVRLPHFAAYQYAAGHPLTRGQLRPGDLLFWARNSLNPATIYHAALYLGRGLMVQAPQSHRRISVASMSIWGRIQFFARPY